MASSIKDSSTSPTHEDKIAGDSPEMRDKGQEDERSGIYPYDAYMWMKKKLYPEDVKKECRTLIKQAWALSFNSILAFLIPITMLFVLGHVNKNTLAGVGLGFSFCNLTGFVLVTGLITACDTMMSQAYGAGNYRRVGILAQRAFVLTLVAILPILALWVNAERVLLALGQKPEVSKLAGEFILYFIPALFLQILYNILIRYLACQAIVKPSAYASALATVINGICCYVFSFQLNLGVMAGAFSIAIAFLTICLYLLIYIAIKQRHSKTWQGFSWECLDDWSAFMSLAIPSMIMVGLEWWCFELGIIILGMVGEVYQATQIIAYNLAGCSYFIFFGLSLAASVRVGNFLGCGRIADARRTLKVATVVTVISAFCIGMLFIILKDVLGYLFTSDRAVLEMTSKSLFIVGLAEILDCTQVVLMGLVRGLGLQKFGAIINAIGNFVIGTPAYCLLVFLTRLGVVGFWTGIITGYIFSCIVYGLLVFKSDLKKLSFAARERSGILQDSIKFSASEDQIEIGNENSIQNGSLNFREDFEEADDKSVLVTNCNDERTPQGPYTEEPNSSLIPETGDANGVVFLQANDPSRVSSILIKVMIILVSVSIMILGIFIRLFV